MSDYYINELDRLPTLRMEVSDSLGVIDLTDATGTLWYRLKSRVSGSGVTQRSITILTPTGGIAEAQWTSGELPRGVFYWQAQFVLSNGKNVTFPQGTYNTFSVVRNLLSSTDST